MRRVVLTLTLALAVCVAPFALRAQPRSSIHRIGVLGAASAIGCSSGADLQGRIDELTREQEELQRQKEQAEARNEAGSAIIAIRLDFPVTRSQFGTRSLSSPGSLRQRRTLDMPIGVTTSVDTCPALPT